MDDDKLEIDETSIAKNHVFICKEKIRLSSPEIIKDCYQKLLELEKEQKVKLIRWSDFTKEQQEIKKQRTIAKFKPLMNEEKKYPESYQALTSMFEELKIDD